MKNPSILVPNEDSMNQALKTGAKLNAEYADRSSSSALYMAERPLNELTDQVLQDGGYHIFGFGNLKQHEPPSSGKPLQYLACADQET